MLTFFQVCFFVGIILTVLSFLLGHVFEILGVDGLELELDIGLDLWLPLSPVLYMMFATIFGGIGIILIKWERPLPAVWIIMIAFISAFVVSSLINKLIINPLKRAQNTSAADRDELIGLEATVTETIRKSGFGEITYSMKGNTYTSPARATMETEIEKGNKVAICWIEDHVFYVSIIDF